MSEFYSSSEDEGDRGRSGARKRHWDSSSESGEEEFGISRESGYGSMHLYCEVCDTTSSSVANLQMHFAGSKHKKKLEMAGLNTKLTSYVERPKNLKIWNSVVRCLLCKVIMVGAECFVHVESSEHQRKLSKMTQRNKDFYSNVDNCFKVVEKEEGLEEGVKALSCGLCKVELSGKEHLELHLNGKKHQKKAYWLRIADREANDRDYKQVWCSLCQVFVNNLEGFEGHIRGKQHIKTLKRAGVKWKVLVDSYGEDLVGGEILVKRRDGDRERPLNHAEHEDKRSCWDHDRSRSHHVSHDSSDKHHTPSFHRRSPGRSPSRHRRGDTPSPSTSNSSSQFTKLSHPSWGSVYSSIPEYDRTLPKVLRDGKPRCSHKVIYQKPLLAVGDCLAGLDVDDPRLAELDRFTRSATLAREREGRRREDWNEHKDRGNGWRDGGDGWRDRGEQRRDRSPRGYRERREDDRGTLNERWGRREHRACRY